MKRSPADFVVRAADGLQPRPVFSKKLLLPAGGRGRAISPFALFLSPTDPTMSDGGDGGDDEAMRAAVAEVERLLGYSFRDPTLLEEALTHSSVTEHCSYQRLEFIGDAALGLAFSNYLFLTNPGLGPGPLSNLRAANISTEKLARVAVRHGLYRFLRRNSPMLDQMVEEFTVAVMKEREEDFDGLPYGGSTIKAPKVLADIVEAVAAAIYVDCNFDLELLWKVFRGVLEPIITVETLDEQPVTTLYELCQKQGKAVHFTNWRRGSTIITNVFVDKELLGIGSSEQKHISKLNAARDALQNMTESEAADMEAKPCRSNGALDEREASKQRLHELCIKNHWQKPVYRIEKEEGPGHGKKFTCSVQVVAPNNKFSAVGDAKSKVKDAENAAASKLLCEISLCRH